MWKEVTVACLTGDGEKSEDGEKSKVKFHVDLLENRDHPHYILFRNVDILQESAFKIVKKCYSKGVQKPFGCNFIHHAVSSGRIMQER